MSISGVITYSGTVRGSVGSALQDLETAIESNTVWGTGIVVADIAGREGKYWQAYLVFEG